MHLLCRIAVHRWNRPRRVKGFLVRRCARCGARQEQEMPSRKWVMARKAKPRKHLRPQTPTEEQRSDVAKGQSA